ncbi:MAG: Rne/Rng family ribonuclease [Bacteroidota bacterium]
MRKEIIINAAADEVRIAITEDGKLAEFFAETPEKDRMVGDIYLGKVARVMPGIRAAFIDIGHKQDAFLHFSDIGRSLSEYSSLIGDDSDIETEEEAETELIGVEAQEEHAASLYKPRGLEPSSLRVGEPAGGGQRTELEAVHLEPGQDIIVQVTKEPVGNKGVRVTSEVSLPGRFLVLLPFDGKIGVSKKITNYREKRRLRRIVRGILPEGFGAIIRTVAEKQDEDALKTDLKRLLSTWNEIQRTVKTETPPALLYKDLSTTSSVIRDLFNSEVARVVVDSRKLYHDITAYVRGASPEMLDRIELYRGKEPIFDAFGIEKELQTAFSRRVPLKSGGYIIIEQTEAMVVIDVNSGRYAARREQELNSLRTDLEAAREIVRQLRLRDIGGIIVVDFIDLEDERNRKKVYDELRKEFRRDRAKTTVLPMTEFGLVQITRQRIRQGVMRTFTEPCPCCGGSGVALSKGTVANQIERWIRRFKTEHREFRLVLRVNPVVAEYLGEGTISRLTRMMLRYFIYIKVEPDPSLPVHEFRFFSRRQKKDITDEYKGT